MAIFASFARYNFWNFYIPRHDYYTVTCIPAWLFTDTEMNLNDIDWPFYI